jgi:hypothetical protein
MDKLKNAIPSEESTGKKDFWVVFLNICLALITIVLLGYIAYKNGHIDLDNILNVQQEEEESEEAEEDVKEEEILVKDNGEVTLGVYEGEAIEAIIPEEWTIVEHLNGEGTEMLPTYTSFNGLTGLEIFNGEKQIMELIAAWAVGFPECPELVVFSDTSPGYVSEIEEIGEDFGVETLITDYTNVDYTGFDWLGRYFRRVGNILYSDSNVETESFDTLCETGIVSFEELSFTNTEGEVGRVYFYGISEDSTEEELKILDGILTSMVAI